MCHIGYIFFIASTVSPGPAISTLTKAIQKGFFISWPGLTAQAIKKYVANMPHVRAGQMDHVRKNIRSTKLQQVLNTILHDVRPDLESSPTSKNVNTSSTNELHWPQHHKPTDDYYA